MLQGFSEIVQCSGQIHLHVSTALTIGAMPRLCFWLAAITSALLAQPYSWLPSERRLDISSAADRFVALCHELHDACDVGIRFDAPKRIDELDISYAVVA